MEETEEGQGTYHDVRKGAGGREAASGVEVVADPLAGLGPGHVDVALGVGADAAGPAAVLQGGGGGFGRELLLRGGWVGGWVGESTHLLLLICTYLLLLLPLRELRRAALHVHVLVGGMVAIGAGRGRGRRSHVVPRVVEGRRSRSRSDGQRRRRRRRRSGVRVVHASAIAVASGVGWGVGGRATGGPVAAAAPLAVLPLGHRIRRRRRRGHAGPREIRGVALVGGRLVLALGVTEGGLGRHLAAFSLPFRGRLLPCGCTLPLDFLRPFHVHVRVVAGVVVLVAAPGHDVEVEAHLVWVVWVVWVGGWVKRQRTRGVKGKRTFFWLASSMGMVDLRRWGRRNGRDAGMGVVEAEGGVVTPEALPPARWATCVCVFLGGGGGGR